MDWLDKLLGFDEEGLEEARLKLQKSIDDIAKVCCTLQDLLFALHGLKDPRIEELFDKYEIEFNEC